MGRARRWPRRLLRLGLGLGLSLLLAIVLLGSRPGGELLRPLVEGWASARLGGAVQLGSLRLDVWHGHAEAGAVALTRGDARVTVERLEVDWSRGGLRVRALRAGVVVTASATPVPFAVASGRDAQPWRVLEDLRSLEVIDGRIESRNADATPWLVIGGLTLSADGGQRTGHVRARDVAWTSAAGHPAEHVGLETALRLRDGRLVVSEGRVTRGDSYATIAAGLERIQPVTAEASAHVYLAESLLAALAPSAEARGSVTADVSVAVERGRVSRNAVTVASDDLTLAGLGPWVARGRGRLDGPRLLVDDFTARGRAGLVALAGSLALDAASPTRLRVRIEGLDPAVLLERPGAERIRLATRVTGMLDWHTKGLDLGRGQGDGTLTLAAGDGPGLKPQGQATLHVRGRRVEIDDATLEARGARIEGHFALEAGALTATYRSEMPLAALPALAADLGATPPPALDGRLEIEGTAAGPVATPRLDFERLRADLAGGTVTGSGSYDVAVQELAATLTASGIRVEQLPAVSQSAGGLTGMLRGTLSLRGPLPRLSGDVAIKVADAALGETSLPELSIDARAEGGTATLTAATTKPFATGTLGLSGDFALHAAIDVAALPLDVVPAIRETATNVEASGTVTVDVPLRDPARVRYATTDLALKGHAYDQEWSLPAFTARGGKDSVDVEGLRLEAKGSSLQVQGRIALAETASHALDVTGRVDLAAFGQVHPEWNLGGTGDAKVHLAGTPAKPELRGDVGVSGGRGVAGGVDVDGLELAARLDGDRIQLDRLTATVLGGGLNARGNLPLLRRDTAAPSRVQFELSDAKLGSQATASIEGDLTGREPALAGLEGGGRVTKLDVASSAGPIVLTGPAAWTLKDGRLSLPSLPLRGRAGELQARLDARLDTKELSLEGALAGDTDLAVLNGFLPNTTLAGVAHADVRLRREAGQWRGDGSVSVANGRFSLDEFDFFATGLGAELRLAGDRIAFDAHAASGNGTLKVNGEMQLGKQLLGPVQGKIEAERIVISYPRGFRGRANASLDLRGEPGRYRLAGTVDLLQSAYTAESDARVDSLDRLARELGALTGGDTFADQVALDVRVRLLQPLRVRNSKLSLDAEGAVQTTGTLAQPSSSGQISVRQGGEITLPHAQIRVSSGRVDLSGYPDRDAEVDMQGTAMVGSTSIDVSARGPLDDLQLTLSSDKPDLTQTDLVALLLTGRTAADAASQSRTVLTEQMATALGGVIQRGVGSTFLIDVSPDRTLLAGDTDPTQRLHIGARITHNLSLLYSVALDGTGKRVVLEADRGGRFRMRATSEEDNSYSIGATDAHSFYLGRKRPRSSATVSRERRPTLGSLRFEGELPVPEAELRDASKLKEGRHYTWLQREETADRVRERLVRDGYRAASVDAVVGRGSDGVALTLRVDAGARVRIEWSGDDPGASLKKDAEKAWPPFAAPDVGAVAVAQAARERLQAKGFYGATVESQADATDGVVVARLRVAQGKKGGAVTLVFDGNHVLSDAKLTSYLPHPGHLAFFEMLDAQGGRLSDEVRVAYAGLGYVETKVQTPRIVHDPDTGDLRVTVALQEGPVSIVESVELPDAVDASLITLQTTPGQPFDLAAYSADRDALAAWLRQRGWLDSQVRGAIEIHGAKLELRFLLASSGARPRIGQIRIVRSERVREGLVRGALRFHEGDFLEPDRISRSRERLSKLGLFRSVEIRTEPATDGSDTRDVTVEVVERPDLDLEYGGRYTTSGSGGAGEAPSAPDSGSVQAGVAADFNNPFGSGLKFRVYGLGGPDRQTGGASVEVPTLLGTNVRTRLLVFDDRDPDPVITGLTSHVRGASVQQSFVPILGPANRTWQDRLRLQWGYTLKNIEYLQSAETQTLASGVRGFLSLAAIGDSRDSLADPRSGLFWTAAGELARTALGSDVDYVRFYGQVFGYLPLGPFVWAQGIRVGTVPGDNPLLLIENRFRAGGSTTIRGFDQNALGPHDAQGNSLGGQAVAILNEELRFPIRGKFKGGLFWDAGNVWALSRGLSLGELRQSLGVGLRFMLPFGPLRFEYAWVLGRQPGEARGRFVFGIGHAF